MSAEARRPWVAPPTARDEGGRSEERLLASGVLLRLLMMLDMLSILASETKVSELERFELLKLSL
jgi:hypothetical protein